VPGLRALHDALELHNRAAGTGSEVTIEANTQTLAEFDALLGADDLTALDRLCRADMVNHAIAADRPRGLAGTREFLETMGRRQMTHEGWRELVVVAEGDYIVQYGVRHGRWHGGEFLGFDAAAGDYSRGFAAMYRFDNGQIAERWAVRDDLTMLRQLGAFDRG
jgi:predicted ester cyclase